MRCRFALCQFALFVLLATLTLAALPSARAGVPAAPTGLTATTVSPSQINLTWTAPTGTVASYNVKRGTATGGPYTTIGSPTTTSYASTGLAAGTRYYYVITAVNASGESVPSAEISRATQCAAPTGFTDTATTTQIGLTWDTTKGATSYKLYRGTSAGGETVYQSGLTGTSYTDTAVAAVTAYYYTLTAVNSAGESIPSAEISSATLCAAPTNLGATTVSPSQINLTWTASAGATSYNINRGTATGGPYTTVGTASTPSYSSTGLLSGTRYYYVITAVNAGGESVPSTEISRATQCAAPTGLTATGGVGQVGLTWTASRGATSYSLYRGTFAGGEGATAYQTGLTGTSYTDTGVTGGTAYYYTLKALNSGGTSAASNEAHATPSTPVSLSSVSVSPASVTGGTSATGTVTLSGVAPSGGVVVTLSDNSPSVTVPASVTVAAGSSSATFSVTTTSVSASATATITATYSGVSKTATLTINPTQSATSANFNLASNPINVAVVQGNPGTTSLSIISNNGFTGQVALSASSLPVGTMLTFSPSIIAIGDASTKNSTINIKTGSNVRLGRYSIYIKGSGTTAQGVQVSSITIILLTITSASTTIPFQVSATGDLVNLSPGTSDTSTISISATNGFSQNVSLSISDDLQNPIIAAQSEPTHVNISFGTQVLAPGGSTTLTATAGTNVQAGVYHLLITATASNGQQAVTPFMLVISEDSDAETSLASPTPQYPNSPAPYPLAASASDMERIDLNGSSPGANQIVIPSASVASRPQTIVPNVVGADDRIPVPTYFPYPYSAVCRITVVMPNGKVYYGSGTLVGRNHVLTAAHLMYDSSEGGYAKVVKVYSAYNGRPNKVYQYAFANAKRLYVPLNYKLNIGYSTFAFGGYDDFALIDLLPIPDALAPVCGLSLGDVASYIRMADDFYDVGDVETYIAGYPGVVNGHTLLAKYMYEDFYSNGSGDKSVYPSPSPLANATDDQLFTAIDTDAGESGGGFLHQISEDGNWTVYGVVGDIYAGTGSQPGFPQNGETGGTRITTRRLEILKNVMSLDGDDIAY